MADCSGVACLRDGPQLFRPQMMLTLLTYSYARGIYGSEDIETAIATDPTVRYICAHTHPGRTEIRRFRRQNRSLLQHALAALMQELRGCQASNLSWTEFDPFEAAHTRIEAAAFIDSITAEM